VFESLENVAESALQLLTPAHYLLVLRQLKRASRESNVMRKFKHLSKNPDNKFWTSIKALHWMATFIDPAFSNILSLTDQISSVIMFFRQLLVLHTVVSLAVLLCSVLIAPVF